MNDVYLSSNSNNLTSYLDLIKDYLDFPLGKIKNNLVLGMGNPNANIVFIGENFMNKENLNRLLFVGKRGELLDKILSSINLLRKDIYILNILKNKFIDNNLSNQKNDNCELWMSKKIKNIRPKIIVALGKINTIKILRTKEGLNSMRNFFFNYNDIDLLVTYHPDELLRNVDLKKYAWKDFQLIRDKYINV
tara:strand:- start:799 stop:1374 length:576 start_codon:yes stop_codon:yes gene_type:complete